MLRAQPTLRAALDEGRPLDGLEEARHAAAGGVVLAHRPFGHDVAGVGEHEALARAPSAALVGVHGGEVDSRLLLELGGGLVAARDAGVVRAMPFFVWSKLLQLRLQAVLRLDQILYFRLQSIIGFI